MARLVEMPKLSPTMEEGQLVAWHVAEGDAIDVDQVLADVETDKATVEFRSFDRGVLLKILVEPGTVLKLGDPVAIVGERGEDVGPLLARATTAGGRATPRPTPASAPSATSMTTGASAPATGAGDGRLKASPYVRKVARERGLDLRMVQGSGPGGRIVARDLEGAAASPAASAPARAPGPRREPERRPLGMMRKTIARRLTESKRDVPHFYLTVDVDAGPLSELRERVALDLAAAGIDDKISYNDLVLKAVAVALARVPECNVSFTPEALLVHRRIDISVAVAVDDGLVTPVVRDADEKSVLAIAREVRALAARARARKLSPEEMSGGTFSVSNLGMFGVESFAAVINPPEACILAVGAVRTEPVVVAGALAVGKRMRLTLSCDHRAVDGALGARLLAALRMLLEHPTQLLVL
jgi:pyruvate dehydrogenase E2 component (dihydrolipoamide acetyltransferase)